MDPQALAIPRRSLADVFERALWLGLLAADTAVWMTAAFNGAHGIFG